MLRPLGLVFVASVAWSVGEGAGSTRVETRQPQLPAEVSIVGVEHMRVNGVALTVHAIESRLSAAGLLDAFQQAWRNDRESSLAPITARGDWRILGRRQGQWFETLQVRERPGEVQARLSTLDLTARAARAQPLPIPMPPASSLISEVGFAPAPDEDMQWLLQCSLQPAQLAAWLQSRLQGRGWRAAGATAVKRTTSGSVQSYLRDGRVLTAAVTPSDEISRNGSALTLLLQRGPAP